MVRGTGTAFGHVVEAQFPLGLALAALSLSRGALFPAIPEDLIAAVTKETMSSEALDLLSAFVGEKRRFDVPVLVELFAGQGISVLGFVTQKNLEQFGLKGLWGFQYANTCSRPRLDGFGGGAHVLDLATGETVAWTYTDGWLAEMLDGGDDA